MTGAQRHIVMFAYFFPPENITGAARPHRFYRYFPAQGLTPVVITASEQRDAVAGVHYLRDDVRHAVEKNSGKRGIQGQIERALRRFLLPGEDGLAWSRKAARLAGGLIAPGERPVLYSTSPPLSVHLAALQFKRRRRDAIWIADFRDPLYGNPFRAKQGLPMRMDETLEALIFRHADVLVANTDTAANMWKKRYPQHTAKIHVIWNGFDPADTLQVAPIPPRPYKVLTHTGTLYGGRHPGVLLESLARLIDRRMIDPAAIRLQLIGPVLDGCIPNPRTLDMLIQTGCVDYVPRMVPKSEAKAATTNADGLLLLDLNEHNTDLQVPAKLFEYLQIGRPVLAWTARHSPSDRILQQSGIEYCAVHPDDSEMRVDEQVLRFFSLPNDAKPMSEWTRAQFDSSMQTATLCGIVKQL
jgi:glycosyltransferase involved in cell wall biosynthesis